MHQLVLVLYATWLCDSRQLDGLVESLARARGQQIAAYLV